MSDAIGMNEEEERRAKAVGAYLDRELPAAERGAFETELFSDAQLRNLYRALGADGARLKEGCDDILNAPVPDRLLATVEREFAARKPGGGVRPHVVPVWAQIAAAIVVVATGVVGASYWVDASLDRAVSEFAATVEADRQTLTEAVAKALETNSSGVPVQWVGAGDSVGTITPVSTYRSVTGHWCREYVQEIRLDGEVVSVRGVACRNDSGEWITLRAEPAKPGRLEKGA